MTRKELANAVYELVYEDMKLTHKPEDIWKAIAEISDIELHEFYCSLLEKKGWKA